MPDGTVKQPSGLLVLFIARAVAHASLVLFSRRTNTSSVLHALRAYVCNRKQNLSEFISNRPESDRPYHLGTQLTFFLPLLNHQGIDHDLNICTSRTKSQPIESPQNEVSQGQIHLYIV